MVIGAIIQARMSSRRLPGKVLMSLAGKPMLQYVVETAQRASALAGAVVATSIEASDDPVAEFCVQTGVHCFRGSLDNVAERFLGALEKQGWNAAVRISADSPLIDSRLIEQAVQLFLTDEFDLVTNVFPRSYPHGQSVEVIRVTALHKAYPKFSLPEEFEHVTPYFYAHSQEWSIGTITSPRNLSDQHLAVDTAEDLVRLEKLIQQQELVP